MSLIKQALIGVAALAQMMGLAMPNAHGVSKPNKLTRRKVENLERRRATRIISAEEKLINSMTNWQNHQWSKAGRPMDMDRLQHFASLPHWKQARAAA